MTAAIALQRFHATEPPIREAVPADNAGLMDLAASCAMQGDIALRMERSPDFFALNRLEGEKSRIGVAEHDGTIVGCIAASERTVYIDGRPTQTGYVGDLKVHPAHRNREMADALCRYAQNVTRELPAGSPVLITVLSGNRSMERRLSGPRGLPRFQPVTTLRTHSVSVLWKRRLPHAPGVVVRHACWRDVDEMVALWGRVAPERSFAPVLDSRRLEAFIYSAPGLDISSYLIARGRDERLLGFAAFWDQAPLKRMCVESYSPRLARARRCFNIVAPLVGGERLPSPGGVIEHRAAFNICVPGACPAILRSLLVTAHNELRHTGCSLINVGLDVRDPLTEAMSGLFAQPTDIGVFVSSNDLPVDVGKLKSRSLHHEIALV